MVSPSDAEAPSSMNEESPSQITGVSLFVEGFGFNIVTLSTLSDGQVLTWDSGNSYWKNASASGSSTINVEKNIDGSLFNGITVIEVNQSNKIERLVHHLNYPNRIYYLPQ